MAADSPPAPAFAASDSAVLEETLSRAWGALYDDDPVVAAVALRTAVCLAPDCGEAWAATAEVDSAGAPLSLRRATVCDPAQRRWRLALGEALLSTDSAAAAAVFAACVDERPDDARARLGWGRASVGLGRNEEAAFQLREAAALSPGDPEIMRESAALYIVCGDPLAAAETLAPITGSGRADPAALTVLGRAWAALGERDKAMNAFARAVEMGDPDAAAPLAALSASDPGAPPPDAAYVRALFDRYAERFDKELVEKLGYRGPQLVAAAAARATAGRTGLRIFDLGCGTGLAGEVLRAAAATLHGVDLSPAMVAQAEKRRAGGKPLYDCLIVGGLVEALSQTPGVWDVLSAADVLMYLGDLQEAFNAAAAALAPGGVFVFTVEAATAAEIAAGADRAPALRESRRYAHSDVYLRAALTRAGLRPSSFESGVLRMDRREPVVGWVVAAEADDGRPGS